jgi:uncharacterized membrane protein (UPF0127 family)
MNRILVVLVMVLFCSQAFAYDESLLTYSRIKITLIPKPSTKIEPLPQPLPDPRPKLIKPEDKKPSGELPTTKGEAQKKEDDDKLKVSRIREPADDVPPPPPPREPVEYTVDVKSPDYFNQDDVISQTTFADRDGLLILIDPIGVAAVASTNLLSTVDILFINEDGYITKIAPKLNVRDLQENISSGKAIRALLYLKPGGVEQERIELGDRFEGSLFKTHPTIIQ